MSVKDRRVSARKEERGGDDSDQRTSKHGGQDATRLPAVADPRNPGVSRRVRRAGDARGKGTAYRGDMADDGMSPHEARQRATWGIGIALGMGVGVALGSALDNMGLGIALGIAIGVAFAAAFGRTRRESGDTDAGHDTDSGDDGSSGDEPR